MVASGNRSVDPVLLDGQSLTLEDVGRAARGGVACSIAPAARERMEASRAVVARAAREGEAVYGVNTGFGDLANVRIAPEKLAVLQERLLLSHAAGMGEPLPAEAVRAMLLLRANALARGHSGVRPALVERLLAFLERDLLPWVPSRGSVGASGDLAPLAHLALPVIGRGRVMGREGAPRPAADALREAGLEALVLEPKEGIALINGTQGITALLALAALEARRLVRLADLAGAFSADALRGTDTAFDPRLHELRPHPGQIRSAANLRRLMAGSAIRESHRHDDVRVQDPYCVRCMPQVHGAARDLLADVERRLAIEINAVTDNPLVFPEDGAVLSGGNFHGEPVALAADVLALGVAELASISERRIEKLTNAAFSALPPFLVEEAGLNSGFMIAQVTAAALVSENKTLCHPASVDSIPTSADKEDHVSMGMWGAIKLGQVVANARRVLAVELLAAAQGIDLLRPLRSSDPLETLHAALRERVPPWREDREMAPDLEAAEAFLDDGLDPHLAGLE
jgi:histidine ammonia-lyase